MEVWYGRVTSVARKKSATALAAVETMRLGDEQAVFHCKWLQPLGHDGFERDNQQRRKLEETVLSNDVNNGAFDITSVRSTGGVRNWSAMCIWEHAC